jgi:hypothetical protein
MTGGARLVVREKRGREGARCGLLSVGLGLLGLGRPSSVGPFIFFLFHILFHNF